MLKICVLALLINDFFHFSLAFVVCSHRLVYFGGYGYVASPSHRGTFELDENSYVVSRCVFLHMRFLRTKCFFFFFLIQSLGFSRK